MGKLLAAGTALGLIFLFPCGSWAETPEPEECLKIVKKSEMPKLDFSGREGSWGMSASPGLDGENGKDIVLILKLDPESSALELEAYPEKKPAEKVSLRLCLPAPKKISVDVRGGNGGDGGEGACLVAKDRIEVIARPGRGGNGGDGGNVKVFYNDPKALELVSIVNRGGWGGTAGSGGTCLGPSPRSGSRGKNGKITRTQSPDGPEGAFDSKTEK